MQAVRERGIRGTIAEAFRRARARRRMALDRKFDEAMGTDTSALMDSRALVDDPERKKHIVFYQPSPAGKLRSILDQIPVRHEDYTFIDYGSGKGRVLLLAAEYPFRAVRGVEFVEELHRVAGENIEKARTAGLRCDDVESVCLDATQYELPAGPFVAYFFTPFRGPIMDGVLSNIVRTVEADPRDALVVYYGGDEVVRKQIEAGLGWEITEIKLPHDPTIDHQRWCWLHRFRTGSPPA